MKTEKVIMLFIISGLVLKYFQIPGGKIYFIFSMIVLSLLYFPFGFYFLSDKKIYTKSLAFSIISGFLLSTLVMGVMMNVMHYSNAVMILKCGIISCVPIGFISYLNHLKPKEEKQKQFYKNIFIRLIFFVVFGLLSFFL